MRIKSAKHHETTPKAMFFLRIKLRWYFKGYNSLLDPNLCFECFGVEKTLIFRRDFMRIESVNAVRDHAEGHIFFEGLN